MLKEMSSPGRPGKILSFEKCRCREGNGIARQHAALHRQAKIRDEDDRQWNRCYFLYFVITTTCLSCLLFYKNKTKKNQMGVGTNEENSKDPLLQLKVQLQYVYLAVLRVRALRLKIHCL